MMVERAARISPDVTESGLRQARADGTVLQVRAQPRHGLSWWDGAVCRDTNFLGAVTSVRRPKWHVRGQDLEPRLRRKLSMKGCVYLRALNGINMLMSSINT
jgi:hypothetical protein